MRKIFTLAFLYTLCISGVVKAVPVPLSGVYTLPVSGMYTLADAIDSMNKYGIGGPVTINLTSSENAPSTGYLLGSSRLSDSLASVPGPNKITINGNGYTLTAHNGVGNVDGIFKICGADYVTIKNLNLVENSANTTNAQMMEWGFAILRRTADDGANYCSIKNCTVTLNKNNGTAASGVSPKGSTGIFVGSCGPSSTALLGPSLLMGATIENNYIAFDTIKNVTNGVYVSGFPTAVSFSSVNDKLHTIEGNVIGDFNQYGIYLMYSDNDAVRSNVVNNMAYGGTAITSGTIVGIFYNGPASATNNNWECRGNNVNLTAAGSGTSAFGIYSQIRGTGTTNILYDTVQLTASGTSSQLVGILGQNNDGNFNVFQNVIQNFNTPTTNTNHVVGIMNGYNTTNIYPANSQITFNTIRNFNVTAGSSFVVAGCVDNNGAGAAMTFSGNVISDMNITGNSASFRGYTNQVVSTSVTVSETVSNNIIRNIASASATTTPFFGLLLQTSYNTTYVANGNKIRDISFAGGSVTGLQVDYGVKATVSTDTFTRLTGGADVYAIKSGYTNFAVTNVQFNDQFIDSLSSVGTSNVVAGIGIAPGSSSYVTTVANVFNNRIFELSSTGTGAVANGIVLTGGSATCNIYNNMLFDIAAKSNTTAYSSSFGLNLMGAGTINAYHNTVHLVSSPASGFGATGLLYNPGASNTFKNNILNVNVTAGSSNNVVAMRSISGSPSAAPSSTSFTSSNNIYYSPVSANNFLYGEGTTGIVNGFHTSGLTASTTNNIVNDPYFNATCGTSKYKKFMTTAVPKREDGSFTESNLVAASSAPVSMYIPTGVSFAEAGGTSTPVGSDIIGASRSVPDMGASQFSGKSIPPFTVETVSSSALDEACKYNLPTLSATVNSYYAFVTYEWYKDTTKITGATSSSYKIDSLGGRYIVKAYDAATGCFASSDIRKIDVVPLPPAIITYYDSLVFCQTSSIVLTANAGKDYTYQWYKNNVAIPGANNIGEVVSAGGSYTVEVNTPLGCPSISKPIGVTVYSLPAPVITVGKLGPKVLSTGKYYTYQWYFYNVPIPGAIGPNYFATKDGPYAVEVTDSNGCTNKSSVYLYSVGVNDPAVADMIKIFPNPTNGLIKIESPVTVNVVVKDFTGKIVAQQDNANELNLSHLSSGIYLLMLTDEDGKLIKTEKITKTL